MFIKFFFIIFIFINCSNTVSSDITSNIDVDNGEIGTSSLESTSTTIFLSSPSSTILKLLPITTTTTTTTTVPQTTTTTTVPQTTTTTTVPQTTTTTTVPQTTTTTTVPQTTTTTTVPQTTTTTTVPQTTTTTTTTVPQTTTTTTVPQTTTTTTVPQTTTTTTVPQTTTSIGVTVANNGFSSNVYFLNGNQDATINVTEGNKYRFDLSDSSNSGHPLRFSTTQNGSEYSSNVIANGIAGTPGAYVEIEITSSTPNRLYLYCINHFGMGGNTVILTP
jgi:hypothetical protein